MTILSKAQVAVQRIGRVSIPRLSGTATDTWVRSLELSFKCPQHVVFNPNRRMGTTALLKVARTVARFVATDNDGRAPGIAVVDRKRRDGTVWPHLHLLFDAVRVSFRGFRHEREMWCRTIRYVVRTPVVSAKGVVRYPLHITRIGAEGGGLEYIAKKLSDGEFFEVLPGTCLKWSESAGRFD